MPPSATDTRGLSDPMRRWSMVRKGGLEPPRLAALEPKSRASTNSATFALSRPFCQKESPARGRAYSGVVGRQGFEPWTY